MVNMEPVISPFMPCIRLTLADATKRALAESFDEVLSLDLLKEPEEDDVTIDPELEQFILTKIQERTEAKKAKDFARADAIRAELMDRGVVLLCSF